MHVLSCSVLLKCVLLISCVFWIFFRNAGSQLCFRFCFVKRLQCPRVTSFLWYSVYTYSTLHNKSALSHHGQFLSEHSVTYIWGTAESGMWIFFSRLFQHLILLNLFWLHSRLTRNYGPMETSLKSALHVYNRINERSPSQYDLKRN